MVAARPAEDLGVISLVIPVYNEQDSLAALLGEIDATARRGNLERSIIRTYLGTALRQLQ